MDWKHTANYVAKRYMQDVERDVYFEDVKLQMDAKLWAEEYDRHNPPKKVIPSKNFVLNEKFKDNLPHKFFKVFIFCLFCKFKTVCSIINNSNFKVIILTHVASKYIYFDVGMKQNDSLRQRDSTFQVINLSKVKQTTVW